MKAAVLFGKQDIRYVDWEDPIPQAGQVKVRVKACGICGSDVPRVLGDAAHFFPLILGHEFSGIVEELGEGVTTVSVGDHCTVAPLIPCMECEDCKKGNYSLCKHYSFIGSRVNGGMAEYVCVPEKNIIKVDPEVSFLQAATFEPSTVSLHAIKLLSSCKGKTAAVLGCGIIGDFLLQWLRIYGASKIVAIGRSEAGLAAAKKLDVDAVLSTMDEKFEDKVSELTGERGFDIVLESAGSTDAMRTAFQIAGNKAEVCFVGTPKEPLTFSVKEWENLNRKEFTLTGSWMSYSKEFPGSEWTETAEAYANGKLKLIPEMIYREIPLQQVNEAFDLFKEKGKVKGRVVFKI